MASVRGHETAWWTVKWMLTEGPRCFAQCQHLKLFQRVLLPKESLMV